MTITELAKLAGVSRTTVSRVLNGKPDVNPETAKKIQELIQANKYVPNAAAKALNGKDSRTIGVIIPYDAEYIFSSNYFVELIRGISTCITDRSFYMMVCYAKDNDYLTFYSEGRVDGFLLISPDTRHSHIVDVLLESGVPFYMTADLSDLYSEAHYIDVDDASGAYMAVKYLLQIGHKKIAYIGEANAISSQKRCQKYYECLASSDIVPPNEYVQLVSDFNLTDMGYQSTKRIMRLPDPPTAIFCSADMIAFGANSCLHDLGFRVPQDVSLIGFDNVFLSKYTVPSLTTVSQPAYYKGYQAANILIDFLSKGKPMLNVSLGIDLVVRDSTMPPK